MSDEPLFHWSSDYQIGHETIDNEHQHLFFLAQELADAVNLGEDNKYVVMYALNQLLDYTETHFRNEEAFMRRHHFKNYQEHVERHSQLLLKVEELLNEFRNGNPVMTRDILLFIKNWLANHILHDDIQLSKLINSNQGSNSAG